MILIGFMGSGKTTIAMNIAEKLDKTFVDMDQKITETAGMEISHIFKEEGEEGFRKRELEALKTCINLDAVISTGGGVVTHSPSLEILKSQMNHKVFYLDAPFSVLFERIKDDESRPLASQGKQKVYDLFIKRQSLYLEASDYTINTDCTITETVEKILNYHN